MAPPELTEWLFNSIYSQTRHLNHRHLLVVTGEFSWVREGLNAILAHANATLSIKEIGNENTLNRKHVLGSECDIAIVHAHKAFNPGNLMAVAGTIRWGGCLILCSPPLSTWEQQARPTHLSHGYSAAHSLYIKRLVRLLKADKDVAIWGKEDCYVPFASPTQIQSQKPDERLAPEPKNLKSPSPIYIEGLSRSNVDSPSQNYIDSPSRSHLDNSFAENAPAVAKESGTSQFRSLEQQEAFNQLTINWSQGKRKAVITAARGRGKSALVGLFAASRLIKGETIFVTSAIRENTDTLFKHANAPVTGLKDSNEVSLELGLGLDYGERSDSKASYQASFDEEGFHKEQSREKALHNRTASYESIKWMASDNPALLSDHCDLLIIDEAASFPLPVLKKLIGAHDNWLVSTTLQGYEGSGQGFLQRMLPRFISDGAIPLSLTTSLRWVQNDKLEQLLHKLFLFEEFAVIEGSSHRLDNDRYKVSAVSTLTDYELHCVMQLLATAHYQTSPDDFMRICDSPDIKLFCQWDNQCLVAAAIINIEGGNALDDLKHHIANGARRPKGHLGAQRLTLITANPETAVLHYWRINRIAVAPHMQGKGLGTALINVIRQCGAQENIDALISSYGRSSRLDGFWQQCQFTLVDMGQKPNKASGETSALVVHPISNRYRNTFEVLVGMFALSQQDDIVPLNLLPTSIQRILSIKLNQFVTGTRPLNQVSLAINSLAAQLLLCPTKPLDYPEKPYKSAEEMLLSKVELNETAEVPLAGAAKNQLDETVSFELVSLLSTNPLPTNELISFLRANGNKALVKALRSKVNYMLSLV
ncbi:GNAT family N-acetyltransferase [Alteromonas sp. 1_MG-2023]|uniref:GNAT family N-acetyltransferase n=1 Tax=Alteromonas sp. 1_MG-2023 TaxID=3062669 RepID=UPI0026E2E6EE|nr:GNAT family N-acetyltransferase [Alteromonas sp. 1_MG-2023]MDO6567180.1 GNAT family N-acetyltransferase [Alteromonas sp. 1_MG-2023]